MSYKDFLLVLDAEAPARRRIDLAAALAERFAAHLVGLYPLPIPQRARELGYFDPAMLDPFFAEARNGHATPRTKFARNSSMSLPSPRLGRMAADPGRPGGGSGAPRPLCRSRYPWPARSRSQPGRK